MSTPRPTTGLRARGGLLAASLLLLSGCGVAGTDWHPGVAVEVGSKTVTGNRVDEVTATFCKALGPQLAQQGQILPLGLLRGSIASQLGLVAAAQELADQYDVDPGQAYRDRVDEVEGQVAALPQDQQDAVVTVQTAGDYINGVITAVGQQQLREQGQAEPEDQAALQQGQKTFDAFLTDNDFQIDPRYGVQIADGQISSADTGLSYALSDTATLAAADQPDPDYAAGLPANQRCG